jgi:histidinol-phosphatase
MHSTSQPAIGEGITALSKSGIRSTLAQGSGEVKAEHGVHGWDIAALIPILHEAGDRFSDPCAQADFPCPDALASNCQLHDPVLTILAPERPR